ncbi:hypothetical protein CR194_00110 [Salipaludibacillus keqinensis]|uniref:DUF302 domain-containing protein n=1 Tax=Salipaludibacillus keqinensis TaxID=2045207 RepID=A0A323TWP6_9BACI|nr:DUF302 domain-containing protein [Salipaludibacillus keqinensis]PYZ93985.1 hypothetical protein CR194_00110 [Salipaludibacillus keqinensis]
MSFDYTVESKKTPNELIESLEKELKEEGFGVLWSFNVKDKLDEKGLDYSDNFHILEVCNPHDAKEILSMSKLAGYFLPCKVVVYEDDGKTFAGMPQPSTLMDFIDDSKVHEVANKVEKQMISCLEKAK